VASSSESASTTHYVYNSLCDLMMQWWSQESMSNAICPKRVSKILELLKKLKEAMNDDDDKLADKELEDTNRKNGGSGDGGSGGGGGTNGDQNDSEQSKYGSRQPPHNERSESMNSAAEDSIAKHSLGEMTTQYVSSKIKDESVVDDKFLNLKQIHFNNNPYKMKSELSYFSASPNFGVQQRQHQNWSVYDFCRELLLREIPLFSHLNEEKQFKLLLEQLKRMKEDEEKRKKEYRGNVSFYSRGVEVETLRQNGQPSYTQQVIGIIS